MYHTVQETQLSSLLVCGDEIGAKERHYRDKWHPRLLTPDLMLSLCHASIPRVIARSQGASH